VAIVQTADQPGQMRIVLADLDGSDPVVISTIMADRAHVCWSADGRWLFWLLGRGSEAEFFAYDLVEAKTRMLAHSHTTSERAIYAPGCG
jgi:Tol biopolymer transport system component